MQLLHFEARPAEGGFEVVRISDGRVMCTCPEIVTLITTVRGLEIDARIQSMYGSS